MKKNRLILLSVSIIAVVSILLVFQLTRENGSSLFAIDYSTTYSTISTIYQRQTFFANGNYWLFYSNGTNLFHTSSPNGSDWRTPTFVTRGLSASAMSVWYENGNVHYANAGGPGSPVVYRKGRITENEIVWSKEQTVVQAVSTVENYNAYITVDSSGLPWISYMRSDSKATQNPWTVQVTTANSPNAESWSAPMQVSNVSFYPLRPSLYAMSNGRMYAIYMSEIGAEGRLWDGTSWQEPETITNRDLTRDPSYSAVSLNDEIHLALTENATNDVYYFNRLLNAKWEEKLVEPKQELISVPVLSTDPASKTLYLLWIQGSTLQVRKTENGKWEKAITPNLSLTSAVALSSFYYVSEGKLGVALIERIEPHTPEVYKLGYFVLSDF
ncbi:MAG TPA: hypothetical protein VJL33_03480 [Candidatus Bathyarchaeia archaeon]|nr:hypothetical protein [Candidatus Bathyarchaeia archaeon]